MAAGFERLSLGLKVQVRASIVTVRLDLMFESQVIERYPPTFQLFRKVRARQMSLELLDLIVLLHAAHVAEVSPILIVQGEVVLPFRSSNFAVDMSQVVAQLFGSRKVVAALVTLVLATSSRPY